VIGTLTVDGWTATFGSFLFSLYENVTAPINGQCTNFSLFDVEVTGY